MARAILRDDHRPGSTGLLGTGGVVLGLDDDQVPFWTPTALMDDPNPKPGVDVLPRLSVRDRETLGYDEGGNPTWTWVDRVTDVPAVKWTQRTEVDERAGMTLLRARVTLAYPSTLPPVRETASVRTSDGEVWSVTNIERYPDRLTMLMERIDDGA